MDKDFEIWNAWDKGGRKKQGLIPLLQRYEPLIAKQVSVYKRTNLPDATIRAKAQANIIDAAETFDPTRGVKLNTHILHSQQKIKRFVSTHQNFARIPEPMVYRIGEYNNMERQLQESLNRDPSITELADKLKWPQNHVERMQKALRKDLSSPMFEQDPAALRESRWAEVKLMLPYELPAFEGKLYETIFKSPTQLTDAQLSKKLNVTPAQIAKGRKKIVEKVNYYLG